MTTISTTFRGLLLIGSFEERGGQFYEAPSCELVGNIESEVDDREELIEYLCEALPLIPTDAALLYCARDRWSSEFESELYAAWRQQG